MRPTTAPPIRVLALVLAAMASASGLSAQTGNQSDITGPGTTGSQTVSGAYAPSPGTVATPPPGVVAAVGTAAAGVSAQLAGGTLSAPGGGAIPAAAQASVLAVLTGGDAPEGLVDALASGGAATEAAELASAAEGLLTNPSPGQLSRSVGFFNTVVEGSSAAFLQNPPAEFQAIAVVLQQLAAAAGGAS